MPELNGREFYHEVRRRYGELTQRIVFITGDVFGAETREFLERTGNQFIEKPFVMDDIVEIIDYARNLGAVQSRSGEMRCSPESR